MTLLPGLSSERLAVVAVGGGVVLAAGMVLLGGFVSAGGGVLAESLYLLAWLLPLLGGGIVLVVLAWAYGAARSPPHREGIVGQTRERLTTPRPVGDDAARLLDRAASARYDSVATDGAAEIRGELADGALRVLRTVHGLDAARAREAVRTGTWTDDPVAAAFLGEPPYPLGERIRGAIDPGSAYRWRVRRTVAAIERVEGSVGAAGPPAGEDDP